MDESETNFVNTNPNLTVSPMNSTSNTFSSSEPELLNSAESDLLNSVLQSFTSNSFGVSSAANLNSRSSSSRPENVTYNSQSPDTSTNSQSQSSILRSKRFASNTESPSLPLKSFISIQESSTAEAILQSFTADSLLQHSTSRLSSRSSKNLHDIKNYENSFPISFNCYNSSHYLTLRLLDKNFVINNIEERKTKSKNPAAMFENDPWAAEDESDNANNTDVDPCTCYLWKKPTPLTEEQGELFILGMAWTTTSFYTRIICEAFTLAGSVAYLVGATIEARFQGLRMFFKNLSTIPARFLFLIACCLVIVMSILRFFCMSGAEDVVAVMAMICTGPYFLFFCRGFKTVGPMVTMIYTMLAGDLLRFVTIYFIFIMGFSQAYYVLFSSYEVSSSCKANPLETPVESVMTMFIMSLGNFGDTYGAFDCTHHEVTSKIMFLIFIAIVSLLLINLLIAMMGNTYQIIAEMKNEWMRQWARIVLVVERGLSPKVRLQKLMEYSQPMSDGRRALVLRLHQDEEEREEMQEILEMQRTHKKYVQRRIKKLKEIEERNKKAGLHVKGF